MRPSTITVLTALLITPPLHARPVDLSWDAPTVNVDGTPYTNHSHYTVYVDGTVHTTNIPSTSITIDLPSRAAPYDIRVTAIDTDTDESDPSNSLDVLVRRTPSLEVQVR